MSSIITTAYASARLDGVLDCKTMRVGILKTSSQPTPVITFYVIAGLQRHPVWALDRLAVVVYCYCQAAKKHVTADHDRLIEINLSANLVSGTEAVCVVASSINWHTSKEIRNQAEAMIGAMTCDVSRSTGDRWPFRDTLQMPVRKP